MAVADHVGRDYEAAADVDSLAADDAGNVDDEPVEELSVRRLVAAEVVGVDHQQTVVLAGSGGERHCRLLLRVLDQHLVAALHSAAIVVHQLRSSTAAARTCSSEDKWPRLSMLCWLLLLC